MKEICYIVFQNINNISSTSINSTEQENQLLFSRKSTSVSESECLFQHFLGHQQLVQQN